MKSILILAAGLSILAGAARAQVSLPPLPGLPELPGAPKTQRNPSMFKPVEPYRPYSPPAPTSVYADGPFSPAGEAKRQRKANAPLPGGPFSPEAEAKREREAARGFHPF